MFSATKEFSHIDQISSSDTSKTEAGSDGNRFCVNHWFLGVISNRA